MYTGPQGHRATDIPHANSLPASVSAGIYSSRQQYGGVNLRQKPFCYRRRRVPFFCFTLKVDRSRENRSFVLSRLSRHVSAEAARTASTLRHRKAYDIIFIIIICSRRTLSFVIDPFLHRGGPTSQYNIIMLKWSACIRHIVVGTL